MIPPAAPLALAQAHAEAKMVDRVVVRRRGEEPTYDPVIGDYVDTFAVIYDGPGEVKPGGAYPIVVGGVEQVLHRPIVKVPVTATGIAPDDEVEVVESTHDPDLTNVKMVVTEAPAGTYMSARRLVCEAVR